MTRRYFFVHVLLLFGFLSFNTMEAHGNDPDEDFDDDLQEQEEVYPLRHLNERRGLDYCRTHPNPCKNGGSCCSQSWCLKGGKYTCRCKGPYSGPNCESKCPLKECWEEYYAKSYSNGHKRSLDDGTCKAHVEKLASCLESGLKAADVCNCDEEDRKDAKLFNKNRKGLIISRQCNRGTNKCTDPAVHACAHKIYKLGGAIDSTKQRSEQERWKASVTAKTSSLVKCMEDKLKACLPNQSEKLSKTIKEIEEEMEQVVTRKCNIHKEVADMCEGKKTRTLSARELLRAILERTLEE